MTNLIGFGTYYVIPLLKVTDIILQKEVFFQILVIEEENVLSSPFTHLN